MNKRMVSSRRFSFSLVIALIISVAAAPVFAQAQQNFPSKPIRLIVPFSTGTGVDINARLTAQKLNESWGQPVVVENRTGGGGRLGAAIVAKAAPDGYTLLWTSAAFTISAALYSDLPYDPFKEVGRILTLPDVKERMLAMGFLPDPCTPEEHERFLRAQIESFSGIIRLAGLRTP